MTVLFIIIKVKQQFEAYLDTQLIVNHWSLVNKNCTI